MNFLKRRWAALFCAIFIGVLSPLARSASLDVVFVNPGRSDEPFWRSVSRFMQPAARQLDIQLEVLYAERDHLKMIELVRQVTQRAKKPDYLIVVNEKLAGGEMLKLAEQARVKTLIAFSGFDEGSAAEFGAPRQKYRYWIGSILPNSLDAGRLTAVELVRQAQKAGALAADGKVHVAAIGGDRATPTGVLRLEGAVSALTANPAVVLEQVVYGNWDRARAREQADALLRRYPQLNAFWIASDIMAYGAIEAAEALERKPGQDLMFSAINNSPQVLQARRQGRIAALAGGHFTAGGWALVMLYDYHHGVDFAAESLELRPPLFGLIDAELAQRFLDRFGAEDFASVDFRQFSRHLHPQPRYRFGLAPLLK